MLLAVALPVTAAADITGDANRLFEEGKELMDRGNFLAACARFEASLGLAEGIGARLWPRARWEH